jgi:cytochrome P450
MRLPEIGMPKTSIPRFSLTDIKYRQNAIESFRKLREQGEMLCVRLPMFGKVWLATTYQAVNEILKTPETFARDPKNAGRKNMIPFQWMMPRSLMALANSMLGNDGEAHRRLRSLVDKAFNRHHVEDMEHRIGELAREQLTQAAAVARQSDGTVDLVQHFARPFPLSVICELLGLPFEDREKFIKWFTPFSTVSSMWGFFKLVPALRKTTRYLREQFVAVRKKHRPGLLASLVEAETDGDKLDDDELLAMVFLLLVAGHETTVHLLTTGLLSLFQFPAEKEKLLGNWTLAHSAVDEMLRYNSPVQYSKPRYVTHDTTFREVHLHQKDMVMAVLASANLDPAKFDHPERFDIQRQGNYHMTFGSGPHVCLGMKLARAEAAIGFDSMFHLFPNMQPAFDLTSPDWSSRMGTRGLKTMPFKLNG